MGETYGQHSIGLDGAAGFSELQSKTNSNYTSQKFFFRYSGWLGAYYECKMSKHYLVSGDLLVNQIEGRETQKTPLLDSYANPTGQYSTGEIVSHSTYLSVPVFFLRQIGKFSFGFGPQMNFKLYAAANTVSKMPYNGDTLTFRTSGSGFPVKDFDLGGSIKISFQLVSKLRIVATYFHSLTNVYQYSDWHWSKQQICLGLRFQLWSYKSEKE